MTPSSGSELNGRWWPAPAKLNLFLHVTGRRADGFHNLQTLFQLLDWGDEIFLRTVGRGEVRRIEAAYDVPVDRDLAVRAARRLRAATGYTGGAEIGVRKRIPMGAGLGGGSSNAATVLVVLNRLWNCGLGVGELAELGLGLGADVPVFVHGHSALATGVGEVLEPVSPGQRHYLLVMPDVQISTAEVFADPRLERGSPAITTAEALAGEGHNDCQPVALALHPELSELMDHLRQFGAPRMSGTGSSMFLPMASAEAARSAAEAANRGSATKMKCRYNVRAVGGLNQSPLLRALGFPPVESVESGGT